MSADEVHVLYRMYAADGALLYVGITLNPQLRFRRHRVTKNWWADVANISLQHFGSREALCEAERAAVKTENPAWNVARFQNGKRPRRTPPMVSLPALRLVGGWSVEDVCDRFEQSVGYRPWTSAIHDFEAGEDTAPEFIAHYEIALGLKPGSISTTYEPYDEEVFA